VVVAPENVDLWSRTLVLIGQLQHRCKVKHGMRERRPSKGWHLFLTLAFLVASGVVVLFAVQATSGYPFRKTIKTRAARDGFSGGFAYSIGFPTAYSPYGPQRSSSALVEDVTSHFLYSQRSKNVGLVGQGIFSFPRKGQLLFSSSDNSDPRINGHAYQLLAPLRISKGVMECALFIWLTLGGIHFLAQPNRQEVLTRFRSLIGAAFAATVNVMGRWPIIVLAIPSFYLLSSYPPLWKDTDALVQLTFPPGDGNILHFPPLYCFLGRIPFAVTSRLKPTG
jgi:hypothetical protein